MNSFTKTIHRVIIAKLVALFEAKYWPTTIHRPLPLLRFFQGPGVSSTVPYCTVIRRDISFQNSRDYATTTNATRQATSWPSPSTSLYLLLTATTATSTIIQNLPGANHRQTSFL
jgi:hypothetical protein